VSPNRKWPGFVEYAHWSSVVATDAKEKGGMQLVVVVDDGTALPAATVGWLAATVGWLAAAEAAEKENPEVDELNVNAVDAVPAAAVSTVVLNNPCK
jgi:hypothetical protein